MRDNNALHDESPSRIYEDPMVAEVHAIRKALLDEPMELWMSIDGER
jgi:hypothetical protein